MLKTLVSRGGFVLTKLRGRFEGVGSYGLMARSYSVTASIDNTLSYMAVLMVVAFVIGLLAAVLMAAHAPVATLGHAQLLGAVGVLGHTVTTSSKSGTQAKKPVKIREMENSLKAIARELEAGQTEMAAGPISQERGEELEQKAKEMEDLQEQIDRYNRISGVVAKSREVKNVTLPGEDGHSPRSVTTTPGHMFIASEGFQQFKSQGRAAMSGWSARVDVGKRLGRKVRLFGEQAVEFERKAFDPSTLSSLGTDAIIQVDRDPELVRYEEPELLTLRDMFTVVPTTSDSVRYTRHTSTTRAAASQASRGAAKGYLKIAVEPATVAVETIAVLSKVTEQDIEDAPRLVGLINGEMTLDVRVEEERQLGWGDGTSGELLGLFDDSVGVPEFTRAEAGDTTIDMIRKMRTDLRKLGRILPNFVALDPVDWEQVELEKGSDLRYVWGLVTDTRGPRIWSLNVVESDGMTNPETGERRLLVGDGRRGATIYDRNSVQLAVGFIDDDFGRNLRTLRAEQRLAFAVKRAWAFEFAIMVPPES